MLTKENFTKEHINALRLSTGADPSILERTVFAFGLLQAIAVVGLPFIFKGGSSLLLILQSPRRLSTDIDILVDPDVDVDKYILEAGKIFPFKDVKENVRQGKNKIVKRHFRFLFESPNTGRDINILLDVVFEKSPYAKIVERPLESSLIINEGDLVMINTPDINSILGDKLTAFAPHTTGISFGQDKELEIIKQFYDCETLIEEMSDFSAVSDSYFTSVKNELAYRGLEISANDVLMDTIESCFCLLGRSQIHLDDYKKFIAGINAIQGHIFNGHLNGENAGLLACSVMYMASCLLSEREYQPIEDPKPFGDIRLTGKGVKKISYIRNVDLESYGYLIKTINNLDAVGKSYSDLISQ